MGFATPGSGGRFVKMGQMAQFGGRKVGGGWLLRSWRNKANFGLASLAGPGEARFARGDRGRGPGVGGEGFDFLERREGAVEGAVGGVDAALETIEILAAGVPDLGHIETFDRGVEAFEIVPPDLRFEGAEAALEPLGGDEGIDQGAHFGSGGLVAVVVFGGE